MMGERDPWWEELLLQIKQVLQKNYGPPLMEV